MMIPLLLALTSAQADEPSPFTCCDTPVVERVVEAWLDAGEALASGKSHATPMQALAKAAKGQAPAEDGDAMKRIASEAKALAALPTAAARQRVPTLAQEVVWLALRHESGSVGVVQGTCAGQGSWLQRKGKKVRNPTGARCGTLR